MLVLSFVAGLVVFLAASLVRLNEGAFGKFPFPLSVPARGWEGVDATIDAQAILASSGRWAWSAFQWSAYYGPYLTLALFALLSAAMYSRKQGNIQTAENLRPRLRDRLAGGALFAWSACTRFGGADSHRILDRHAVRRGASGAKFPTENSVRCAAQRRIGPGRRPPFKRCAPTRKLCVSCDGSRRRKQPSPLPTGRIERHASEQYGRVAGRSAKSRDWVVGLPPFPHQFAVANTSGLVNWFS